MMKRFLALLSACVVFSPCLSQVEAGPVYAFRAGEWRWGVPVGLRQLDGTFRLDAIGATNDFGAGFAGFGVSGWWVVKSDIAVGVGVYGMKEIRETMSSYFRFSEWDLGLGVFARVRL